MSLFKCVCTTVCVFVSLCMSVCVQTRLQVERSCADPVELEEDLQQLKVTNMEQSRIAAEAAGTPLVHGLFFSYILISNIPTVGIFSSYTNSYLRCWGYKLQKEHITVIYVFLKELW